MLNYRVAIGIYFFKLPDLSEDWTLLKQDASPSLIHCTELFLLPYTP